MATTYFSSAEVTRPPDLGGATWRLLALRPITVIFGKNGGGKSRLLRAWRDQDDQGIHYIVPERTGTIGYEANLFHQQLDGRGRREQSTTNFVYNYRQQVVSRIQGYFATRGGIVGEVPRGDPAQLQKHLSTLLPDFMIELRAAKDPPYMLSRTADGQPVQNIEQLSSGEAEVLTIGLDLLTIAAIWDIEKREKRLALIDEPDAHIHPDLQVRFADFLVNLATEYKLQIAIATHSTTLLAAIGHFAGESAGVVYLDRTRAEHTVQKFDKYKKELSACLGGHALMGPLFGVPLLLVEGDDDYRLWSQVPRHHRVSFAVVPCSGDEIDHFQKALEQLFASLREDKSKPAGLVLLDGDKSLPQANKDRPQDHMRFIKLACHEAENLYITDEVFALFGANWTSAVAKVKAAADKFGQKAGALSAIDGWDRKRVDLKGLMEPLTAILDDKQVHWTLRVARAVGEKQPTGQLAEFLGEQVLSALWGSDPTASAPA